MSEEPKLDFISDTLMNHLHAEAEKGTKDGATPLEAIQKFQPIKGPKRPSSKPQILDIEGFHVYNDPMTLMFLHLSMLRDPRVDAVLQTANFTMSDIAGKPIFPRADDTPKS